MLTKLIKICLSRLCILALFIVFICFSVVSQNVGINTTTPDESALLELQSTEQGFLPPRLTTLQRDAIDSPATGLIIYNLTESCINYFDGIQWLSLCGSGESSEIIIDVEPINVTECEGQDALFSVDATGAISYQWQVNSGGGWTDITDSGSDPVYSGYNTSTLQLSGIVAANDNWLYRCIISGNNPPPAVSEAVSLSVLLLPEQPSAISGPIEICGSSPVIAVEEFNSNILVHGASAPTNVWFAPDWNTPIAHSASGGCPGGHIGYSGNWNNYWGNFVRLPTADCSGLDQVSLTFDVSHSHFAAHTNDWCRFYIWADGGYEHNVVSVEINGVDVTYDSGVNGKGFRFTEVRSCDNVEVIFDISGIANKSDILCYIEPSCGYNNSNTFYVWFDNISLTTGGGSADADYSIVDEGYDYEWLVPVGWTINSGQFTNSINVTSGSNSGDVIVIPSNACGAGPSQSISVEICP